MKLKEVIRVASQVMSQRIIIIIIIMLVNIIGVRVRMRQYPHMLCECDTVSSIINKRN